MTTGRINQVCQMLLSCTQIHEAMDPYGPAAKVQLFTSEQSSNMRLLNYHPANGTYNLTLMNCDSVLSCDNAKAQDISLHTILCVIKQLHCTQRVSMTTQKLTGLAPESQPLYQCFSPWLISTCFQA